MSDPDEPVILYAIEGSSKARGMLVDAVGPHVRPSECMPDPRGQARRAGVGVRPDLLAAERHRNRLEDHRRVSAADSALTTRSRTMGLARRRLSWRKSLPWLVISSGT